MTKVAIVTASDSGIGKACALLLAQNGFDIGITWHSDERGAQETAKKKRRSLVCGQRPFILT